MRNEYQRQKKRLKVLVELAGEPQQHAEILLGMDETLANHLNGSNMFVEVEDMLGQRVFIAKTALQRLIPQEAEARKDQASPTGAAPAPRFVDAYAVLDVDKTASDAEVQDAYHRVARAYHPDRLAGLGLPEDILRHGEDMLKRINAAYDTVTRQRRSKNSAA